MEWNIFINSKSRIASLSLVLLLSGFGSILLHAQSVPSRLLSIPVYTPVILNPAYAGSKDYTNISLTSRALKWPDSQILNYNRRLSASDEPYSRVGFGAYAFQEQFDQSWNSGIALTAAYHFALDRQSLHFISAGATLKGIFAVPKDRDESPSDSLSSEFRPNVDIGVYYYGPHAFGGISATTLFGAGAEGDSSLNFADFERQYHFQAGYKFLVSTKLGIVIEPSLIVSLDDQNISDPFHNIVPYLRVYLKDFYLGTYVKDLDLFALFFQYQFPRFYTGAFMEFPRVGYLNDDNIIFEITLGLNLGKNQPAFTQHRHW